MRHEVRVIIDGIADRKGKGLHGIGEEYSLHFDLDETIIALLAKMGLDHHVAQYPDAPGVQVVVGFGEFSMDYFQIAYWAHIAMSKLGKVWKLEYISHIGHPNPDDATDGKLTDVDVSPITKRQFEFENDLTRILEETGYVRLLGDDLVEVIPDLHFQKESMKFFGPQATVEMVLFRPFWG